MVYPQPDDLEVCGRRGRQSVVVGLLFENGRMFKRGTLPPRRGGWYRQKKSCFRNACLSADTDPERFTYCEGFCWASTFGPFRHAWFIDNRAPNVALDSTANKDSKYRYLGLPIPWRLVREALLAEGRYGVFDYLEKQKEA